MSVLNINIVTPRIRRGEYARMGATLPLLIVLGACVTARGGERGGAADEEPEESMVFIDAADLVVEDKVWGIDGKATVTKSVHRVKPFSIDTAPVTNMAFAKFVEATSYASTAEIAGWSLVLDSLINREAGNMDGASPSGCVRRARRSPAFCLAPEGAMPSCAPSSPCPSPPPLAHTGRRRYDAGRWRAVAGAHWKLPEGESSSVAERGSHPATHVSYTDAEAYCAWAKKRLPLEMEWRRAASMGHIDGDEKFDRGGANFWEGSFPHGNTKADGWVGTSPVRSYRSNDLRIFDLLGNVWEWVDSEGAAEHVEGLGKLQHLMGGSFADVHHERNGTVITRQQFFSDSSSTTGFRCASSFMGVFGGGVRRAAAGGARDRAARGTDEL